ncbi:hypothetical protein Tco_0537962 [Tanacetum coccineum]
MGRVIHHQTHPIGQSHVKNDTLDDKKAQERWEFTLVTLSKEAQAVSITDCQAGNPSFGKEANNGRASKDLYWLINDKPELLISSLSIFAFV